MARREDERAGAAAGGLAAVAHGVAVWSSPAWRAAAVSWLDERLSAAGLARTGEVEQPHLRPWATVLRVPTTDGTVWLKAAAPGTKFEAGLYGLLTAAAPGQVLTPLGADPARGWLLLPDGGPTLGQLPAGTAVAEALTSALVQYGELQRALAPKADALLAAGVADMRPGVMPQRFEDALEAVRAGGGAGAAVADEVAAEAGTVAAWCERLAAPPVPSSLDHNDLHPWNILGDGTSPWRFYDWGDSVVAHPFAATLVPLGFVLRALDARLDDPAFLAARDAYLGVFADLGSPEELAGTLEVACQVAKIARVLTWDRAIRASLDQGEEVDDDWATAPAKTLASLLDASYPGGA